MPTHQRQGHVKLVPVYNNIFELQQFISFIENNTSNEPKWSAISILGLDFRSQD